MNEFDTWNHLKQKIHKKKKIPYFREGQIWWVHLGINIGKEIYGKNKMYIRPCLIYKKTHSQGGFIIPLSSKIKTGQYYQPFSDSKKIKQCAHLNQLKYIDAKRLFKKMSDIKKQDSFKIQNKIVNIMNMPSSRNEEGGASKGNIERRSAK